MRSGQDRGSKKMKQKAAVVLIGVLSCGFEIALGSDAVLSSLKIGLSSSVMEADVNADDALAATRVWAGKLGGANWRSAESMVFLNVDKIIETLGHGQVDILAIGSNEYFQFQKKIAAEPSMVYVHNGEVSVEYVLLVRKDSHIESARDLEGKRVALNNKGRHCLASIWLDTYLMKNGSPGKEIALRERKIVGKTSQAILPVFFSQMDAALVVKSAYQTAVTLNPQIGRDLKIIAASTPLVPIIVCLRESLSDVQRAQIEDRALRLHETPEGLQTFTIFKIDRIVSWQKGFETNVRQLMEEYETLKRAGLGRQ
jgi:ABC-type phosphate/phosphonate transport system substrate-binding protein